MRLEIDGKQVTPIEYARSVTVGELKKVVRVIKKADYDEYADRCRVCFEKFLSGDIEQAEWWSNHANLAK